MVYKGVADTKTEYIGDWYAYIQHTVMEKQ
jgi:hypothetical protein